jgi:hypothetical protein
VAITTLTGARRRATQLGRRMEDVKTAIDGDLTEDEVSRLEVEVALIRSEQKHLSEVVAQLEVEHAR